MDGWMDGGEGERTHTHTHTHERTHTNTRTHEHTNTRTRANTHTNTRTHEHTNTRTSEHTHTHTHTHTAPPQPQLSCVCVMGRGCPPSERANERTQDVPPPSEQRSEQRSEQKRRESLWQQQQLYSIPLAHSLTRSTAATHGLSYYTTDRLSAVSPRATNTHIHNHHTRSQLNTTEPKLVQSDDMSDWVN